MSDFLWAVAQAGITVGLIAVLYIFVRYRK